MNDNPYGRGSGCGSIVIWGIGLVIVLAIVGALFGVGPMGPDKYHCYTQPVGPTRSENMITGLTKEQVVSRYGSHQLGVNCFPS